MRDLETKEEMFRDPHALVVFRRSTGNIAHTATTKMGAAQLRAYIIMGQRVLKKSEDAIIFNLSNGKLTEYYEGAGTSDMPII